VLECLQRSVKTADMCSLASSQHVHLFVEVLNHYLCFYEAGCPTVTEKYVSALISFVNDKRDEGEVGTSREKLHRLLNGALVDLLPPRIVLLATTNRARCRPR
jgi:hypothetical protein